MLTVLLIVAGVVLTAVIIMLLSSGAGRPPQEQRRSQTPVREPASVPISERPTESAGSSFPVGATKSEPLDTAPDSDESDDELDALTVKNRIRELEAGGKTTPEALTAVIDELDDTHDIEDVVSVLHELRYPPCDLAPCLLANRYGLPAIINLLRDPCDENLGTIVAGVLPVADGVDIQDRARTVLRAIESADEADWENGQYGVEPSECVEPLLDNGCSAEAVITLLYEESDLLLGQCIAAIPTAKRPTVEVVARLIGDNQINPTTEDECASLQEDADFALEDVLRLARIAAVPAEQAAELLDDFDDHDEGLKALLAAGYPATEAFKAFYDLDDVSTAEFVEAALNVPMPMDDIVAFLIEQKVDPEELDNDLHDDTNVSFRDRIMLLAALLAKAKEEPPVREG